METEKDNKIVFLHLSVTREPYRRLTTSVYRKPTQTNQYSAHDSHHPQSVRRSIVKCLYDRTKRLAKKTSVIKEKRHLSSVLVSNGFSSSFVQKVTKTRNSSPSRGPVTQFKSTAFLLYAEGVSEPLRRCLQQQGICAVFKSETPLTFSTTKGQCQSSWIEQRDLNDSCECGKIYIGEIRRPVCNRG